MPGVMLEEITNTEEFYAGLPPLYHLIYPDWRGKTGTFYFSRPT